jgi:hypothetical protein
LRLLARRDARIDEFLAIVSAAVPVFDAYGDDHSLARTWAMASYVHGGLRGRYTAAAKASEKALAHAQRSGWPPSVTLQQLAADLCYGPMPTSEAIPRCEALMATADRTGVACVSLFLGLLTAMRGDFHRARGLVHSTELVYRDLGWTTQLASSVAPVAAEIEMWANNAAAAERLLRESCETLLRMHEHVHLASQAGQLANALSVQGQLDEADYWIDVARDSAMDDDIDAQMTWRHAKANVLSRRGHNEEAVALARAARSFAMQTDGLNHRAIVATCLADALQRADESDEAASAIAEAVRLFERKENLVAARSARAALDERVTA